MKAAERISQKTYMKDPWIWTMVWGLIMGVGNGLGGGEQRGKIGTTVIVPTIKY